MAHVKQLGLQDNSKDPRASGLWKANRFLQEEAELHLSKKHSHAGVVT